MAYEIVWSPASRDDLFDIIRTIALDNPERAKSFAYELIQQTDRLESHPESGRIVPECKTLRFGRSFSDHTELFTGSSTRER